MYCPIQIPTLENMNKRMMHGWMDGRKGNHGNGVKAVEQHRLEHISVGD